MMRLKFSTESLMNVLSSLGGLDNIGNLTAAEFIIERFVLLLSKTKIFYPAGIENNINRRLFNASSM